MENQDNLFNATVIGENANPNTAFIVEGNHLHAIEQTIANQKKDKSDPKKVVPMIRDALKAIISFADGKVEGHFLEVDWNNFSDKPNEQELLVQKIYHIYSHLPHHVRNELSSLIHHKSGPSKR